MFARFLERLSFTAQGFVEIALSQAERRAKRFATIFAFLQIAIGAIWLALLAFGLALFFQLADLERYVVPAVITGMAAVVLGAIVLLIARGVSEGS